MYSRRRQDHDETFQAYSSFTTNYKPADQYESLLVKASKSKAQAVKGYQRRENYENSLVRLLYERLHIQPLIGT